MKLTTTPEFDLHKLKAILVNSGFQKENNPLYQTVQGIIDGAKSIQTALREAVAFLKAELEKKRDKSVKIDLSDTDHDITGVLPVEHGGSFDGEYDPELDFTANLDSVSVEKLYFYRVGNSVTVYGHIEVVPTTSGVETSVTISLPIDSGFSEPFHCAGVASSIVQSAMVEADTVNNRAVLSFISVTTGQSQDMGVQFSYKVL